MVHSFSRRTLLLAAGASASCLAAGETPSLGAEPEAADAGDREAPFRYCLNTSTIRGQKLPLSEVVDIAAAAGYDGIEPWIREIQEHQKQGGSLKDLQKQIADRGLKVESAIGFAAWMADDDAQRAKGLEDARRDMDLVRQIGGTRIAAPPAGATNHAGFDLFAAAERYAALLKVGDEIGVTPQLEFWGPVASLHKLSQAALIATECGCAKACLLPDVYHMFRGGSDFAGLKLIAGGAIHNFHINDYPGDIPRLEQNDGCRVYPGDGVAPLGEILRDLHANGFRGSLSLELFNKEYWSQDPGHVAATGLAKMQASVAKALG
jgi:sugar phosphate isomerase/epimerase